MPPDATTTRRPSNPLAKYSALLWPYAWSSSAGRVAIRSIDSSITAAPTFTSDSRASDRSPTELVSAHAAALSASVLRDAAIESHA
jgi:hypothetical protein